MSSSFGWNSVKSIPTASSEVWSDYLKVYKEAARYHHKSLPYYDVLEELYIGVGAIGEFAHSGLVGSTVEQEIQNTIAVDLLLILANSSSQDSLASYQPDEYLDNSPPRKRIRPGKTTQAALVNIMENLHEEAVRQHVEKEQCVDQLARLVAVLQKWGNAVGFLTIASFASIRDCWIQDHLGE
ncbi:hypothetical protein HOY80DRAFT_1046618 [Tuber brumale]|nr:hypothetical protein HOY80DRAFT_1046618 [Tuber brumale]